MLKKISVPTHNRVELVNIISQIRQALRESKIKNGLCTVFVPHTTAGVTINENADPDVKTDIIKELNKIIPFNDGYAHMEGNSAAHIKATLTGNSETIIVENGELVLGVWQDIYFCEYDGPRNRSCYIKIISE
ncbi:MAG: secondary thiamine-phosphate synthase enzyme YjbQ [Calditrichia bacterium]|nr:secondary thiamine-phosphate synthase enzyme YjbQ [Calditrichia bacterium]